MGTWDLPSLEKSAGERAGQGGRSAGFRAQHPGPHAVSALPRGGGSPTAPSSPPRGSTDSGLGGWARLWHFPGAHGAEPLPAVGSSYTEALCKGLAFRVRKRRHREVNRLPEVTQLVSGSTETDAEVGGLCPGPTRWASACTSPPGKTFKGHGQLGDIVRVCRLAWGFETVSWGSSRLVIPKCGPGPLGVPETPLEAL